MSRINSNFCLESVISLFLHINKDIRYIQALWCLDIIDSKDGVIIDRFAEEPHETIMRILPQIKALIKCECKDITAKFFKSNIKTYLKDVLDK